MGEFAIQSGIMPTRLPDVPDFGGKHNIEDDFYLLRPEQRDGWKYH